MLKSYLGSFQVSISFVDNVGRFERPPSTAVLALAVVLSLNLYSVPRKLYRLNYESHALCVVII